MVKIQNIEELRKLRARVLEVLKAFSSRGLPVPEVIHEIYQKDLLLVVEDTDVPEEELFDSFRQVIEKLEKEYPGEID